MQLSSRWVRPPAALRRQFAAHERSLAVGQTPVSVAVATNLGLWSPEGQDWRLIGWADIVQANWSADGLDIIEAAIDDDIITDRAPVRIVLTEPRNVPAVVRARVENSIARTEQIAVPGGRAKLVARRRPGIDGLEWSGRFTGGTPDTPGAGAAIRAQIDRLRDLEVAEGASDASDRWR